MTRRVRLCTALLSMIALSVMALPEPRVDAQTAPPPPTIGLLRNNALNGAVLIGDLNNDGKVDAVASDPWSLPGTAIIAALGLGNGRFGTPIRSAWRGGPLTVGDYNADGFLDLVIMADPGVQLLPGRGDGTFGTAIPITTDGGFYAPFAITADYDQDGKYDLAIGNADQDIGVEIFRGNGDGTFGPSVAFLPTSGPSLAGISVDIDGDVDLDIVVANHDAHSITLFRHQTGFLFSATDIPLDAQVNAVAAADLNLDGRVDLVAATSRDADDGRVYVDGAVQVLIATASGYAPPVKYQTPPGTWKLIGGDFNRDGMIDLATANRSATVIEDSCGSLWDTVTILPGNGDGTFAAPSSFSLGDQRSTNDGRFRSSVFSLAGADLTGDGRTDIITSWGAVVVNNPPDPNWGPSVTASSSQPDPDTHRIQLNASANDVDQDMLTFSWTESGGQFIDPVPNPCFSPDTLGVHTFTVTVNDGHGHTATSSVTVDFGGAPAPYTPPVATFDAPLRGEVVTAGQPYTIRWRVTPGSHPITKINLQSWMETSPPTVITECTNLPATATSCVWNSPGPISETAHISVDFTDTTGRSNGTTSDRFIIRGSAGGGGTLAYGWTASDVGAVSAAGHTTHDGFVYNGEGLTLFGSGADIWNAADEFHYAWRTLTGDFEVLTRVTSIDPVNPWTKAGLMVRRTATDAASPHVSIFATPSKGIALQRRTTPGGTSLTTAGPAMVAPLWLRMIRMNGVVKAFYRKNPTDTWTMLGQQAVADWPSTVSVGLAVTSHADGTIAKAQFQGVWTSALPQLTGRAIGAATGSVAFDGTTYTVKASGTDIWGTSDGFFFVEMPIGDFRMMSARVRVVGNTDPWAKAGVMIRENLAADSRHADLVVTPSKGIAFQYRASPGGTSASAELRAGAAPILLRIIRSESASGSGPTQFDANYSTNGGLLWRVLCCAASMPMNHFARIGLAVSSHKPGVETTAIIDDVRIEK